MQSFTRKQIKGHAEKLAKELHLFTKREMVEISDKAIINMAAKAGTLDECCKLIQDYLGVETGDNAAWFWVEAAQNEFKKVANVTEYFKFELECLKDES